MEEIILVFGCDSVELGCVELLLCDGATSYFLSCDLAIALFFQNASENVCLLLCDLDLPIASEAVVMNFII